MINPDKNFLNKIKNFIYQREKNKKNINILEFGVRQGRSTNMFLKMCKKNKGKLLSIDIDDYSKKFFDKNWTFVQCRDDDYKTVIKFISKKLDIILIDSLHEPDHVKKLIYFYWKFLKKNCSIYIDDISWIPYLKNNWRNHKFTENINRNTFYKILEIYSANYKKIDLDFTFNGSGMCRIIKKDNSNLNPSMPLYERKNDFLSKMKKMFY